MKINHQGYTIKTAVYGDNAEYGHRIHVTKHRNNYFKEQFVDLAGVSATREEAEQLSMEKGKVYIESGKIEF